MKFLVIGLGLAAACMLGLANEVGRYCEDINPYAPEDYPKADAGEDF